MIFFIFILVMNHIFLPSTQVLQLQSFKNWASANISRGYNYFVLIVKNQLLRYQDIVLFSKDVVIWQQTSSFEQQNCLHKGRKIEDGFSKIGETFNFHPFGAMYVYPCTLSNINKELNIM